MENSTSENSTQGPKASSFSSAWITSVLDFWQTWYQMLSQFSSDFDSHQADQQDQSQMKDFFRDWNDLMQAAQKAIVQSGIWERLPETLQEMPFISMNLAQKGMTEVYNLAQEWMQGMEQLTQQDEEVWKDPFQSFTQMYANTWHKVLNIPALGPERFRQQRMNQTLDNWTMFINQFSQLMEQLALPFQKAIREVHNKIQEIAEAEQGYPETFQEYYNIWMNYLEGHFMVLFQSQEFSDLLNDVVNRYVHYQDMQSQVLQDWIKYLPVPSNQDFDALAWENYQLKKRMNQLARKVEVLEEQFQGQNT